MFYRIRIDLAFHPEDPIDDIRDKALDHFSEAFTINPGTPEAERGFVILEKCYHDEGTEEPCELIEEHLTPE